MSTINTASLPDLVAQGEIMWRQFRDQFPQDALNSGIYKVENFGAGQGDTVRYSNIDGELYAKNKAEGAQASEGLTQQGYGKEMTFKRRALTKTVTWEMRRRNKYREIEAVWQAIGTTVLSRRELDLQHRITFGTATTYTDLDGQTVATTTGDGLQLFYSAHTVNGSSSTYRNRVAGNPQLSKGGLEAMEKMIVENSINELGEKVPTRNFDVLFTTDDPNTMNTARELLQATAEISSPNEGVPNVYRGKYRHVKLPLVATTAAGAVDSTKAKYWGLVSSSQTPFIVNIEENLSVITPATNQNTEDILTDDWIYKATGSYGIVTTTGQGVAFSSGDGAA